MSYLRKLINNWPLGSSSIDLLMSAERMLREAKADQISWSRSWACQAVLELCALRHFQFDSTAEPLDEVISDSIRLGIDFYYGTWWHKENVIAWCEKTGRPEGSLERIGQVQTCAMLSSPAKLEPWRDTLSALMFLCTVSNELASRSKICDWFGAEPLPEYSGLYWETEATTIVLASYLRSKPMAGIEKLVSKIAKCKRPYALSRLKLIQACFEMDQTAFAAALPEALDRFYKSFKSKEPAVMSDLVAVDESTVVQIALSKGLALPELTEMQQWALITSASIGLEQGSQP